MTRRMRGGSTVSMGFASVLVSLLVIPGSAGASSVPGTTCAVFPRNNVWHMNASALRVNARSAVWKRATHAGTTFLHPDFGPPSYGIPYAVVGAGHAKVSVSFTYANESDPGPYPFGPDIPIEGGSDRHALVIDRTDCTLYELFAARWNGGDPKAGSGAIFHLTGPKANRLRPAGWTSAEAAGLPMPADGRSVPASCFLRHRSVRAERPCGPSSDETVRAHRRRQRERLVLPRNRRPPLDLSLRRSAEADPGERLRRRRRTWVQGREWI